MLHYGHQLNPAGPPAGLLSKSSKSTTKRAWRVEKSGKTGYMGLGGGYPNWEMCRKVILSIPTSNMIRVQKVKFGRILAIRLLCFHHEQMRARTVRLPELKMNIPFCWNYTNFITHWAISIKYVSSHKRFWWCPSTSKYLRKTVKPILLSWLSPL